MVRLSNFLIVCRCREVETRPDQGWRLSRLKIKISISSRAACLPNMVLPQAQKCGRACVYIMHSVALQHIENLYVLVISAFKCWGLCSGMYMALQIQGIL